MNKLALSNATIVARGVGTTLKETTADRAHALSPHTPPLQCPGVCSGGSFSSTSETFLGRYTFLELMLMIYGPNFYRTSCQVISPAITTTSSRREFP